MASFSNPQRLLIIDIDGLRQDVFHQALAGQRVPNLARLLGNQRGTDGIHLDPVSTAPSITFCAQSSIFTGAHPREHGLVGNQFFDRFGESQRLAGKGMDPRFYAFDVGDALAYEDAVLTFSGEVGLLNQALNPRTPTLYERAARHGLKSAVVYHMISRGAGRWIRPNLVDIGRLTKGGGLMGMRAEQYDEKMMDQAIEMLREGDRPDVLTVYFMGLDHTSHHQGPGAQPGYLAEIIDPLVGRLVEELEALELLEGTLVALVSDHGQIEVIPDDRHSLRMSFPFDHEMAHLFDALGIDVNDKPGEGAASAAVVASNGGLAHVYLRRGAIESWDSAWSEPPRFSTDVLPVARAFWEAHQTGQHAPDLQGALAMVLVRQVERDGWLAGYAALTPTGDFQSVEDFLAAHPQIRTVDAAARLRLMAGAHSGDVLLVSDYAQGFYFGGAMVGVHGGLHPEESLAVASLGWSGASAAQWDRLRQTAEQMIAERKAAEGREFASVADTLPILVRMMGLEG